jgi:hypothetical protein
MSSDVTGGSVQNYAAGVVVAEGAPVVARGSPGDDDDDDDVQRSLGAKHAS